MGLALDYTAGQSDINEEEKEGLKISSISTQRELNEFEQLNIEKAVIWMQRKKFKADEILSEAFLKNIHKKMFGEVWNWAGEFRTSEKDIGVAFIKISEELNKLLADTNFWIAHKTYPADEIAIRFKHRLVSIHCFSNGNGRHSRIMADIIIQHIFTKELFTWGNKSSNDSSIIRKEYLNAIKIADQGNMLRLLGFARN